MGTVVVSTCAKASRGTWPPLGYAVDEEVATPPKALPRGPGDEEASTDEDALALRLAFAAVNELDGPKTCAAEVPPETRPEDDAAAVRMNRLCRSTGFWRKSGFTSSTT